MRLIQIENFARVHNAVGVKNLFYGFHQGNFPGTAGVLQVRLFGHTHTVFG